MNPWDEIAKPSFLIIAVTFLILGAIMALAIATRKRKRRQFYERMASRRDVSDEQFCASLTEIEAERVLEMRRMLAEMLGVEPRKIHPDWRFLEDPYLKEREGFIFSDYAHRYAPDRLRDGRSFEFPVGPVSTVRDLFLETRRLETDN